MSDGRVPCLMAGYRILRQGALSHGRVPFSDGRGPFVKAGCPISWRRDDVSYLMAGCRLQVTNSLYC